MEEMKADPDCQDCGGSGIEPGSGDDHGMPYGIDPGTYEPCHCVFEQQTGEDDHSERL
jgi:hypothetical protein